MAAAHHSGRARATLADDAAAAWADGVRRTPPRARRVRRLRVPRDWTRADLTLLYTDIVDSTPLAEALGDHRAHLLLRQHNDLLRGEVAAHGGEEVRFMGDGFLFAFAQPRAAVAAAVAIQTQLDAFNAERGQPPLRVRIGAHWGCVLRQNTDLFGRAVILAQRVMSQAGGGEVLISDALRRRLANTARLADRGLYRLKGMRAAQRLYEVVWQRDEIDAGAPAAAPPPPAAVGAGGVPLVGRQRELVVLERALERAEAGDAGVVVVGGDAGMGKTRLVAEFLAQLAPRRVAVGVGRCFAELGEPYQPFLACLRQLLAHLPAAIPAPLRRELAPLARTSPELSAWLGRRRVRADTAPAEERMRLLSAFTGLFLHWAQQRPVLLCIDDLQWADASTIDLIRLLTRRMSPLLRGGPCRLLVVATHRADLTRDAGAVGALLDELAHDGVLCSLPLAGLDAAGVGALLRAVRGREPSEALTDFVAARSLGNPYVVEQIGRQLAGASDAPDRDAWQVPPQVGALIEQRLAGRSPACLEMLSAAALIGMPFRLAVLRAVLGGDDAAVLAALDEALGTRLLREEREGRDVVYAFEHSLVAEVLVQRLSLARRQRWHAAIAAALAADERSGDARIAIAAHLLRAGDAVPAAQIAAHAVRAGDHAMTLFAFADAAGFYDAALAARGDGDADDPLVRSKLSTALGLGGRIDDARLHAEQAIAGAEARGDRRRADQARVALAVLLMLHARHHDALPYLAAVVEHAPAPLDAFHGYALSQYAVALDLTGASDALRSTARRLAALAGRLDDARLRERAQLVLRNWYANHTPEVGRALRLTQQLLRGARRRHAGWDEVAFLEQVALFRFHRGQVGRALAGLDEALALAERIGAPAKIVDVRALRAMCCCFRGDWAALDAEWSAAAPLVARLPGALRVGWLIWARTRADLWLGRPLPNLRPAEQLYPGLAQFQTVMLAFGAVARSEQGDGAAADLAGLASAQLSRSGCGVNWTLAAQALASTWANLGRADAAGEWYAPLAHGGGSLYLLGAPAVELGRIAALNRRWEAAAAHFAEALALYQRERLRALHAVALAERAILHARRATPGDREAARMDWQAARALFEQLGMRQQAHRAGRRLDAALDAVSEKGVVAPHWRE